MRQVFRYFFLFAAIILTISSLTVLSVRSRLLDPTMYSTAMEQSGIYSVTSDILNSKVTNYLISVQKQFIADLSSNITPTNEIAAKIEPLAVVMLNSLVEKETGKVVQQVSEKIQLENAIAKGADSAITYSVKWLSGKQDDPKLFAYIPEPEKLQEVKSQGLVSYAVKQIKGDIGISDLPPCTTLVQVTDNVKRVVSGNVGEVDCYSPEIRAVAQTSAQIIVPKIAQTQLALTITGYLEKYQIKQLAEDVFNSFLVLSEFKQDLYALRDAIAQSKSWAMSAFGFSVVCMIIGLVLTKSKRLKTLFISYLWVGAVMGIGAGLYMLSASYAVSQSLPNNLATITDPSISEAQKIQLAQSIRSVWTYIAQDLATGVLTIGLLITAITVLGLVILHFTSKKSISDKKSTPPASSKKKEEKKK